MIAARFLPHTWPADEYLAKQLESGWAIEVNAAIGVERWSWQGS